MIIRFNVTPDDASTLLWGLVMVNLDQMKRWYTSCGSIPSVIHAINHGTIVYNRRDPLEHWQTVNELLVSGGGDCEDLSAAVCAELILMGYDARPYPYKTNQWGLHHVVVESSPFGFLDPSIAGGM